MSIEPCSERTLIKFLRIPSPRGKSPSRLKIRSWQASLRRKLSHFKILNLKNKTLPSNLRTFALKWKKKLKWISNVNKRTRINNLQSLQLEIYLLSKLPPLMLSKTLKTVLISKVSTMLHLMRKLRKILSIKSKSHTMAQGQADMKDSWEPFQRQMLRNLMMNNQVRTIANSIRKSNHVFWCKRKGLTSP